MTRVLVPSGALALGYDKEALARGLAAGPDIIAIDGGSTDSGPHYLGTGTSKYSRTSTKVEWAGLMDARQKAGVPLVIGTAGTCGADSAVDWLVDITREIATETGQNVKVAVLRSGQSSETIAKVYAAGRINPLDPAPALDEAGIRACTNIVALAGAEQVQAALDTGADIVIAGRATDTAIISALPLKRGAHPGGAWHGAKIGECGALCATNPQTGVILIDFDETGFTISPMAETSRATPQTVSAHMLYENSDPYVLYEPGGHLDVAHARYDALDDRRVRVTGSEWVASDTYTVKLEGARRVGFNTVAMALVRDPRYVENIDKWCEDIEQKCRAKVMARLGLEEDAFRIELRKVGQDAALGAFETQQGQPVEIGVMGIVTAQTQDLAQEIGKMLNPYLLHHPLTAEEEQPTFAFPFSPPEMNCGAVYEFCLNHVMELTDPMEAFRLDVIEMQHA